MSIEKLLEEAKEREKLIKLEWVEKTRRYEDKVKANDKIRQQMQLEENILYKEIPLEYYHEESEWNEVLEEISVLEKLIARIKKEITI